MGMERTTPMHATNHYRRNRDSYDQIRSRLSRTREAFLSADKSEQILMLQKSHSFAVISVQTPVPRHEEAFTKLWEGVNSGRPVDWNIEDALQSVNYRNNKASYIRHSINHANLWEDVIDLLESGDIDGAHKYILTNFKGVGPAKAPFVLAMLGFEEKMCVDTNIVNAMGLDAHINTVVVEKYDAICASLRDKMPTLKSLTTPFIWQWVVFDWRRGEVSMHDTFFEVLGTL